MSKKANQESNTPTSFSDAGYRQAKNGDNAIVIAKWVLDQCPDFLETEPKELKTQLYAGFLVRKNEITPPTIYKVGDMGDFIPCEPGTPGSCEMTVTGAMAYSQQEFGKMRATDPQRHAVIRVLRDAFSDYAGNNYRSLTAALKNIVNAGKTRKRAVNADFVEAVTKFFDAFEKRVRTASERGDATADVAKFKTAVDAFWRAYRD